MINRDIVKYDWRSTGINVLQLYVVLELFLGVRTKISLCAGFVANGEKITIESLMPAHGIIFSDGIEADHLKFNSGAVASIGMAEEKSVMDVLV